MVDLTGRARIRDAALLEFADRGVRGATVRGIATRAGVSPALVQHHFGTKDALRTACDEFVVEFLRRQSKAGVDEGGVADEGFMAAAFQASAVVSRYLSRALVDGSPAATRVFDELVEISERYLVDRDGQSDSHGRAVVYTAMRLGVTVLHEHVSRGLGAPVFTEEGSAAVARATLDIVAAELIPDGLADQVRAGLDHIDQAQPQRREADQPNGDEA